MKNRFSKKTHGALIAILVAVLIVAASPVLAQSPGGQNRDGIITEILGAGAGYVLGVFSTPAMSIWYGLMLLLRAIYSIGLSIVAFLLNNIFFYNIELNPNNMKIVQELWTLVRDLINSFFILAVLWIAFTIIFNIEQYGGWKLLGHIIGIALVINFSLAFTGVVFGFGNLLAMPFRNAIPVDVSAEVINRIGLHTFVDTSEDNSRNVRTQLIEYVQNAHREPCGFGALIANPPSGNPPGCVSTDLAASLAGGIVTNFERAFTSTGFLVESSIRMTMATLFLFLTVATFIGATVVLIQRVIWMVILGITAPAAFLFFVLPGTKKYGDLWLSKLLCWSLVAPAFYFLFYVSLRVLVTMTDIPVLQRTVGSTMLANALRMIPFFVFLALLWMTIFVGKKMGCAAGGDIGLTIAKKIGSLTLSGVSMAVTAGTGVAARAAAQSIATSGVVGKAVGRITTMPGLRWAGETTQRFTAGLLAEQHKLVENLEKGLGTFSKADSLQGYRSARSQNMRMAYLSRIAKEGWFNDLDPREQGSALTLSSRYGLQKPILQSAPHLATADLVPGAADQQDAINTIVKSIEDVKKISKESKQNAMVVNAILRNLKGPKQLENIAFEDSFLFDQIISHWQQPSAKVQLENAMNAKAAGSGTVRREDIDNYLAGGLEGVKRGKRARSRARTGLPPLPAGGGRGGRP